MKNDFTTQKYSEFLESLLRINFPIYTIIDWIEKKPAKGLILRHDVDRKPNQAIKLAKIAFENDVQATFNFRVWLNFRKKQLLD